MQGRSELSEFLKVESEFDPLRRRLRFGAQILESLDSDIVKIKETRRVREPELYLGHL